MSDYWENKFSEVDKVIEDFKKSNLDSGDYLIAIVYFLKLIATQQIEMHKDLYYKNTETN